MTTRRVALDAAPHLRAPRRHVRRRRGLVARRRATASATSTSSPGSPSSASATATPRRSPPRTHSSTGSGTCRTSTRPSRCRSSPRSCPTRFGGAHAFFCNSGAESIEAALKWARKATGRSELVALEGSFHGRTMGALSVTGQPAKRAAFEPLVPGAVFATPETLADARRPADRRDPARAGAGRGRRASARARGRSPRRARSPTSTARC